MRQDSIETLERLTIAAHIVARRPIRISLERAGTTPWTDGDVIHIGDAPSMDLRRQILAQAALVGAGTLDPVHLLQVRSRRRLTERYHAFEAARADHLVRMQVSGLAVLGVDPTGCGDPATSPAASLAAARSRTPPPVVAWWWGELRAGSALREATRSDVGSDDMEIDIDTADVDGADGSPSESGESSVVTRLADLLGHRRRQQRGSTARAVRSADATSSSAIDGTGSRPSRREGVHVHRWVRPDPLDGPSSRVEPGVHRYAEWDHVRGTYRPDWCTVREVGASATTRRPEVERQDDLRRALAGVGLSRQRRPRMPSGDDIDLDAVVDAATDRAAGREPCNLVYVDAIARRRDLSVLVLVDVSASARDRAYDGRSVHDHQVEAADALVDTFSTLGDRVALHTFRSNGRGAVEMTRVKWFDEGLTTSWRDRLASIEPSGRTRLGAAVRHATMLLDVHGGTGHRLLLVLSDGFAFDNGYEGDHAQADTRRALREARQVGIGCLCLAIAAPDSTDDLRAVFGATAFAKADRLEQLSPDLAALMVSVIRTAAGTRRRRSPEACDV